MERDRDDERYEVKDVTLEDVHYLSLGQVNSVEVTDTETGQTERGTSLNSREAAIQDAMNKMDDDD